MKIILSLILSITLVSAKSTQDLEAIANNIISNIGGQLSANQTVNEFISKTQASKRSVNQLNANNKGLLILEGIGSIGGTVVLVKSGNKAVNISNVYGLGAGAVAYIEGGKNNAINVDEKQELKSITDPLYEKYVKPVVEKESADAILVAAEGGKAGQEAIITNEGHLTVKAIAGFKLGSITKIVKSG